MHIKNNKRNYRACFDGITKVLECEVAVMVFLNGKPVVRNLKGLFVISMDIIQQGNLIINNNKRTTLKFIRVKK